MSPKITSTLTLAKEHGDGKLFFTGDDRIQVLSLKGSWYDMGVQYGTLSKESIVAMYKITVEPFYKNGWSTEEAATAEFGTAVLDDSSARVKEFCKGIADAMGDGWTPAKVMVVNMSGVMARYQSKLHSFSGCTTLFAWGSATPAGKSLIAARNMDWAASFSVLPTFLTVFNPSEPSTFSVANCGWAGWFFPQTAVNEKGVYLDLHDGSSMGGDMVFMDRASMINSTFDWMVESPHAESLAHRLNGSNNTLSLIYSIGDTTKAFSFECPVFDNRRCDSPEGVDTYVVVNSYQNKDWGIQIRETMSNSLRRLSNLKGHAAKHTGKIDAACSMEIFDIPMFNEDNSFHEGNGVTKPTKQDADLTNYQMVTDVAAKKVFIKMPLETAWREVDYAALFA